MSAFKSGNHVALALHGSGHDRYAHYGSAMTKEEFPELSSYCQRYGFKVDEYNLIGPFTVDQLNRRLAMTYQIKYWELIGPL